MDFGIEFERTALNHSSLRRIEVSETVTMLRKRELSKTNHMYFYPSNIGKRKYKVTGHNSKPSRQPLHEESEDGCPHEDPEEPELSHRSGLQIRLNVAGIQVGDAHEEPRASEGPQGSEAEGLVGVAGDWDPLVEVGLLQWIGVARIGVLVLRLIDVIILRGRADLHAGVLVIVHQDFLI